MSLDSTAVSLCVAGRKILSAGIEAQLEDWVEAADLRPHGLSSEKCSEIPEATRSGSLPPELRDPYNQQPGRGAEQGGYGLLRRKLLSRHQ